MQTTEPQQNGWLIIDLSELHQIFREAKSHSFVTIELHLL